MYKILIVDDEAVVREGIRDNINWSELGFELVGDCENGSEALEVVDRLQPDVVLTDICMPFLDGLELARYISVKYPRIKVIILTGYDEFEYAHQAVKLKAYDFLLKPITAAELRRILDKVKNDLDEETEKLEDLNRLKIQFRESLPLLRERFLNRLLSGHLRAGELEGKLDYFKIDFKGNCYLVMAIDIDDYGELGRFHPNTEDELLIFAVFNICEEIVSREDCGIVFQNRSNKTVVILSGNDAQSLRDNSCRLSEEIRQSVEKYLKFTITIGIGTACFNLVEISQSYKSAVSALDYRLMFGKNKVIDITDLEQNHSNYSFQRMQWEKRLASAVKLGTAMETDEIVEGIIKDLKKSLLPVERCYSHIQQVIASIMNTIDELGMDEVEVFGGCSPFTEVYRFKTMDEIEVWIKNLSRKTADFILNKRSDYCKIQVMKAEEYIRQNYWDENLSLNSICRYLFLSTSYFSLIFKSHTGETFIEYLTRVRVDKAMELFKTSNFKTYEVSNRVGYADSHYFSLIFKKATGMTPTEYRAKVLKENVL